MREKILDAIYKKLDEEPENLNLQRQINLISRASICTIHSFCLDVIRNNFFEIDISSNFRIGSEEEITLMKQEVLENVFEKKYEEEDENFLKLVDTYGEYTGDEKLQNLILKIYSFASSSAFPDEWLKEKGEMFNINQEENKDFSETIWGKILINELKEVACSCKDSIKECLKLTNKYEELIDCTRNLEETLEKLREFNNTLDESWDKAFEFYNTVDMFPRWKSDKNVTLEEKEIVQKIRQDSKKEFKDKVSSYLSYDSKSALRDIADMYSTMKALCEFVLDFDKAFKEEKKEKNLIDFNDIEHYALNILIKKQEGGGYIPTEVAKNYSKKFEEIAIDEYQDSNNVQELILSSISRGNNIFTVGDVKQSIYRFRKACPELFLDKYHKYSLDGNENGLKIKLFKNFRSRENILNFTNLVFENIMSEKLGEIEYSEDEFLNLGAKYEETENTLSKSSEIYVIENNEEDENIEDEESNIWETEQDDEEQENIVISEIKELEKEEIEAKFIAKKIKELINSKVLINDKKLGLRPIKYRDIVILMRSTKSANSYEKELVKNKIPTFTDGADEYLDTIEIQTIMNLLKILDNSLDDIALVSVLRSTIFNFTDNEIVEIRLVNLEAEYFWNSVVQASQELENEALRRKVNLFLDKIQEWKEEKDYLPISEFLWKIFVETGFYNYCRFNVKWWY